MLDPDPAPAMPRFCQMCAGPLASQFLDHEGRERLACAACGFVHYQNPRLVANVIPERGGRALLIRRGIEPSYGKWAFPGGFLELGETAEEGAEREAMEEVGLRVKPGPLLGVYTRVRQGIVVLVFRGVSVRGRPVAGPEVLETAWVRPSEVPWDGLAFETTTAALRDWVRAVGKPSRRSSGR